MLSVSLLKSRARYPSYRPGKHQSGVLFHQGMERIEEHANKRVLGPDR